MPQVLEGRSYDLLLVRSIYVCQHFQHMSRNVFGGRVQQRPEVGEWQSVDDRSRIVLIECPPGPIARLRDQHPPHGTIHCGPHGCLCPSFEQSQDDDRRVVDIWIDVILEFECPATARHSATTHLPIAACGDLLLQDPLDCTLYAWVVAIYTGAAQRQECPDGIPDRGHTGLKPPPVLVFQHEALLSLDSPTHDWVIGAHTLQIQSDQRVHPRWLDTTPAPICLLSFHDPIDHATPGM